MSHTLYYLGSPTFSTKERSFPVAARSLPSFSPQLLCLHAAASRRNGFSSSILHIYEMPSRRLTPELRTPFSTSRTRHRGTIACVQNKNATAFLVVKIVVRRYEIFSFAKGDSPAAGGPPPDDERRPAHGLTCADGAADVPGKK